MTENIENLADIYSKKLVDTTNVGLTLTKFMCELINKKPSRYYIIRINKLIKIFGRWDVYFAIIELANVKDLKEDVYPILFAICRSRHEKKYGQMAMVQYKSLNREINDIEKQIENVKKAKIKIPNSDDLGKVIIDESK